MAKVILLILLKVLLFPVKLAVLIFHSRNTPHTLRIRARDDKTT